jgi:hypothetical protein
VSSLVTLSPNDQFSHNFSLASVSSSHTNWLNALRRSYNRRVSLRSDNPFYQYLVVPDSVVRKELERERLQQLEKDRGGLNGQEEGEEEMDEEKRKGIFSESEEKLRLAEGKKPLKVKSTPLQENAINDGFNAEFADLVAQDAAQDQVTNQFENEFAVKEEEENGNGNGNGKQDQDEEEFWEEQRAVEWKDLSLETKVSSLFPFPPSPPRIE